MIARVLVVAALIALGCDSGPECGQGTVEVAGLCLPASEPRPAPCGPRTEWDPETETCRGLPRAVCDSGTEPVEDSDGSIVCVGRGLVGH